MENLKQQIAEIVHNKIGFFGRYGDFVSSTKQCDDAAEAVIGIVEKAIEDAVEMEKLNYQGAMTELEELLRVIRENPKGLPEYVARNYPQSSKKEVGGGQ